MKRDLNEREFWFALALCLVLFVSLATLAWFLLWICEGSILATLGIWIGAVVFLAAFDDLKNRYG